MLQQTREIHGTYFNKYFVLISQFPFLKVWLQNASQYICLWTDIAQHVKVQLQYRRTYNWSPKWYNQSPTSGQARQGRATISSPNSNSKMICFHKSIRHSTSGSYQCHQLISYILTVLFGVWTPTKGGTL